MSFGMNRPCTAPLDSGFRRNDGVMPSTRRGRVDLPDGVAAVYRDGGSSYEVGGV